MSLIIYFSLGFAFCSANFEFWSSRSGSTRIGISGTGTDWWGRDLDQLRQQVKFWKWKYSVCLLEDQENFLKKPSVFFDFRVKHQRKGCVTDVVRHLLSEFGWNSSCTACTKDCPLKAAGSQRIGIGIRAVVTERRVLTWQLWSFHGNSEWNL